MSKTSPGAQKRRATMKDVAALAGVGLSTVSRVVSGNGPVSDEKAAAVHRAIRELDFRLNDFARNLRTGKAEAIGVVVTQISDPFYSTLVSAVEAVAQRRNVLALLTSATDDPVVAERVVRRLIDRRPDGLIVVLPEETRTHLLQQEAAEGLPLVFADRPAEHFAADAVLVDNVAGMVAAVRHLAAHGHTRIACLHHVMGAYTSATRARGFREGMRLAGLVADEALIEQVDDTAESCATALARMDALASPPTAIIATNSRTTKAVLAATLDRTRRAFVGFDDFDTAPLMVPPTTTIVQDPAAIGTAAAELLFQRIDGLTGPVRRVMLGTHLVVRGSGELQPLP